MLLNQNKIQNNEENVEKIQTQSQPTPVPPTKTISLALPANLNSFITTPLFSSLTNRKNSTGQKA